MMKKYLDSNVFLNPILYEDEKAEKFKIMLSKLANKEILGITSILTWDEIVYVVDKYLGKEISVKEGRKFLEFPNLIFLKVDRQIILEAQKLIEKYNLKPRDAIHTATAISQDCMEIVSDDSDFDVVKEIKRISPF